MIRLNFNDYREIVSAFPHVVRLNRTADLRAMHVIETVIPWCSERFGPSHMVSILGPEETSPETFKAFETMPWFTYARAFYFRDERHAFEFKMRWG